MKNLSTPSGAATPALLEADEAVLTATHSLPSRPSSSPAGAKPEARCSHASAPGPVRASAAGTAGAAAPLGSGPPFRRPRLFAAGLPARSCIRTQDGTVILLDRMTGRAVSARDRTTGEALLSRSAEPPAPDLPDRD